MKTILVIMAVIALCSCAQKPNVTTKHLSTYSSSFIEMKAKAFNGDSTIENSLLNVNGDIVAMHDPYMDGSLFYSNLGPTGKSYDGMTQVLTNTRFTYVMQSNAVFYNFGLVNGNIYLWKSSNLINWTLINNGNPVLTHSSDKNSIYYTLYNVGVAVDDNNVWHLLVETSDGFGTAADQGNTGLGYSFATMSNDQINFDTNRLATMAIPHGGNPDLKFVPGKGLLATHGQLNDKRYDLGSEWYITMSTLPLGQTTWVRKDMVIGTFGVHVADPSLVETSYGTLIMSVSFDQNSTYLLESSKSLSQLFTEGM